MGPINAFCEQLHREKYRLEGESFEQSMLRVASGLADDAQHFRQFNEILTDMRFMPGGRIQTAIGAPRLVTPYNCLAGDTLILTREHGAVPIADVSGKVVQLLDGNGDWVPCPVIDHGEQDTVGVTFKGGFEAVEIRATLDHGWVRPDREQVVLTRGLTASGRTEIDDLRPSKEVTNENEYRRGVQHGLIYGDGTQQDGAFFIRVCSHHDSIEPWLVETTIRCCTPPSFGGDPVYRIPRVQAWADLKALPSTRESSDYLLGFLRGWFAADGCVSTQPEATICAGPDEMVWLQQWGPLVGWHVRGYSKLASETNFGPRKKMSLNVRFKPSSMDKEDFLIAQHAVRWEKGSSKRGRYWRASRDEEMRRERVYCPVVSTTHSFALACGIHSRNCFVSGNIADSFVDGEGSIMHRATQAAQTMRKGGGIGYSFGTLRPRGALIKSLMSHSTGPISFMSIFNGLGDCTSSVGERRGAQMGVMPIWHPNIEEFIEAKANHDKLTRFNVSIGVTDEFMECLYTGKPFALRWGGEIYRWVDPVDLWDKIMRTTWEWAEPGVLFLDRINQMNNLWYCEEITATNPCVTKDTWVQTAAGPRQVARLIGRQFDAVIDGQRWTSSDKGFFSTGIKPVFRVRTKEGFEVRVTADHPIMRVVRQTRYTSQTEWTQVTNLKTGDLIRLNDHNGLSWSGAYNEDEGYLMGLLVGDGTFNDQGAVLSAWTPPGVNGPQAVMDRACHAASALPHRSDFRGWMEIKGRNEFRLKSKAITDLAAELGIEPKIKSLTPALEATSSSFYRGFLRGLFDADGSVQGSQTKGVSIRLTQSDRGRLHVVQRMLARMGIISTIYEDRKPSMVRQMPDGNGGSKECACKAVHELVIARENVGRFAERIGFEDADKALRLESLLSSYTRSVNRERFTAEVVEIVADGEEEVFDCQVPGKNAFDANGIVVHNCGEQPLPPFGACLLGSFNLARYLIKTAAGYTFDWDRLRNDVAAVVRAQDNVVDYAIYPLPEQEREAKSKRRMGLGVFGLANAGEALGHPYGSADFVAFERQVLSTITRECYLASINLAKEKGAFPLFDAERYCQGKFIRTLDYDVQEMIARYGIRNSHLTSIAPTGTISQCADYVSSSIEPVFDYVTERAVEMTGGKITVRVPDYAYERLGVKGKRCRDVTVQEHLDVLLEAQKHVDSSISKTLNVPPTTPMEDFKRIYTDAYNGGAKGCTTYQLGCKRGAVLKEATPDEGQSCTINPETGERSCQ